MPENSPEFSSSQLIDYLKDLDERVTALESAQTAAGVMKSTSPEPRQPRVRDARPGLMEINLGEYWFAYAGIIALVLGFLFLLALPLDNITPVLPPLAGLLVAGGMIGTALYIDKNYRFLALLLWGAAFVIAFMSALRVFYFGSHTMATPGMGENVALTVLALAVVAVAHLRRSAYLSAVGITLVLATGLVINLTFWTLLLNTLAAALTVFYTRRFSRVAVFVYGAILIHLSHLFWAIGDPFLTHHFALHPAATWCLVFLSFNTAILSSGIVLVNGNGLRKKLVVPNALANGAFAFILAMSLSVSYPLSHPMVFKLSFFLLFFGLALLFWSRLKINFSMVLFTLLGYGAVSIGFMESIEVPMVFIFLIWQSLIVLATALWFKSRFIIVSNFLLYLILFLAYSATSGLAGVISVSFGFVALLSSRMLRWQQERIGWQADVIIDIYLAIAFFSMPYALWKSIPSQWVGVSWLGVTLLYYALSVALNSRRYRWMAHLTLIATLIYVTLIATIGLTPFYRILTLFALSLVLISVSVMYTHIRKGNRNASTPQSGA